MPGVDETGNKLSKEFLLVSFGVVSPTLHQIFAQHKFAAQDSGNHSAALKRSSGIAALHFCHGIVVEEDDDGGSKNECF
jgi:hypothetical protein